VISLLLEQVRNMQMELTSIRQDIHAHPEMAMEEVGTLKSVNVGESTIGLRADIDALRLIEKTDAPYCSTKSGIMHACGHDEHTTMLLGVAKYLAEHRDSFCGTVHFIFQPAEEGQTGAIAMINDCLFDRFPLGHFSKRLCPLVAACDRWYMIFRGTDGHGGAGAHLATDVTILQAQFLLA
jgi:amidohydrolase